MAKLTEDIVLSIKHALERRAPRAWTIVEDVVRRSPFTRPSTGRGHSLGGFFTPVLKKEEYELVLTALELVARVDGPTAQFADRQIDLVIMRWRSLNSAQSLT